MYIEKLHLTNIRTFVKNELRLLHPDSLFLPPGAKPDKKNPHLLPKPKLPNVNLLLGDNGSGKSSILRALSAAAFGPVAKDLLRDASAVRFGEKEAVICSELLLHEQDRFPGEVLHGELQLKKMGERLFVNEGPNFNPMWAPVLESENDSFFIVGYGATRRVEQLDRYDSGARTKSKNKRDQRVWSLFEDSFSLTPLGNWLPGLRNRNPGRYKQVVNLLNRLLEPGSYRFGGKQDKNGDYLYLRGKMPVPFQSLSDGYRGFIGWIADLLFHVCFGCPSGKKLVDNQGVVLVDEIDLHLHPKWQMQVIATVAKALPRMQFVFTSHSPLVAGSLEWMNIITLKVGNQTNRTIAKRLPQRIHGLDADQILQTEFFGLKSTRAAGSKRAQLNQLRQQATAGGDKEKSAYVKALSTGTEPGAEGLLPADERVAGEKSK